jgi:hypothetical protein
MKPLTQPAALLDQTRAVSMTRYRVTISGSNKAAMADLVRKYNIEVSDPGAA